MWFRRFRRRRATQFDLSELDRLAELVRRITTLLPEQPPPVEPPLEPPPEPLSEPLPDRPRERPAPPQPAVRPEPPEPVPGAVGLLFVATSSGYRLVASAGVVPARGGRVELADGSFRVVRVGPSPLPGDRRRCAFLEREEPSGEARSPTG